MDEEAVKKLKLIKNQYDNNYYHNVTKKNIEVVEKRREYQRNYVLKKKLEKLQKLEESKL